MTRGPERRVEGSGTPQTYEGIEATDAGDASIEAAAPPTGMRRGKGFCVGGVLSLVVVLTSPWWFCGALGVLIDKQKPPRILASGEFKGTTIKVEERCFWGCGYIVQARRSGLFKRARPIAGLDCGWDTWHVGPPFNVEQLQLVEFERLEMVALASRSEGEIELDYLALYYVGDEPPRHIEVLSPAQLEELNGDRPPDSDGRVSAYACYDFYEARNDAIRARLERDGADPLP